MYLHKKAYFHYHFLYTIYFLYENTTHLFRTGRHVIRMFEKQRHAEYRYDHKFDEFVEQFIEFALHRTFWRRRGDRPLPLIRYRDANRYDAALLILADDAYEQRAPFDGDRGRRSLDNIAQAFALADAERFVRKRPPKSMRSNARCFAVWSERDRRA